LSSGRSRRNDARRRWADVGLVLGDLESDDDAVDAGMTPAEVWAECLEDARGTLAHVCDATCPPDERRP
jgi:hypothetical protein